MTEVEKYNLINSSETEIELATNVELIADTEGYIKGRLRFINASVQALQVGLYLNGNAAATVLTRSYGIRQQAIYLRDAREVASRRHEWAGKR